MHDTSLWLAYTGPDVYGCPVIWWTYKGQRKSTLLHNEMDAKEGHLLNRYGICSQMSNNKKTYETR